ncbi:MAG: class I SAM-dependent methyltransferase, partial [Myxococcales bacterium]|nr:class I SAM-dependent methyltransferase [Myxococcales bacterium]
MTTAYDAFPYRSRAYMESHIDRLYLVAHLFGLEPVPVDRCRVLEIGCADGGNLVPMAERLPNSEFVGVDLAARQVEDGQRWIEPLGLTNVELVARNFRRIPQKYGQFDYIVCHGVYSWVPERDRTGLLEVIKQRLTPNGVAYISYNTFPGWNTRRTVRQFLQQHTEGIDDPEELVERARVLLRFLHDASSAETSYGRLVRAQCEALVGTPPQYLFHGLLAEHNDPCYLREFVKAAGEQGLQYLGDAEFGTMMPDGLHAEGRRAMESVPGGLVEHEQVQDFLVNRSFRRTLLVHDGFEIERSIPWERVETLWISARARLLEGDIDGLEEARFDAPDHVFVTDNPILKAGLAVLDAMWPRNCSFQEWVSATVERSGRMGPEVRSTLGRNTLPLFTRGVLRLHPRDLGLVDHVSEKPLSTPWIRRRAELFKWVTDLRHGMRDVPPVPRFLLPYCDGKHTKR